MREAGALWQHILGLNAEVSAGMAALAQEASENPAAYAKALKAIVLRRQGVATGDGDAAAGGDEIMRRVDGLMEAMRQLRTGMRTMGEVALMLPLTSHVVRSLLCDIHMHRSLLYFICVPLSFICFLWFSCVSLRMFLYAPDVFLDLPAVAYIFLHIFLQRAHF